MKKLMMTGLLVCLAISGFSQEKELFAKRKTAFGVTGGWNTNFYKVQLNGNDSAINHDTAMLFGGLFVEFPLNEKLSLQTELLYSRISSEDLNLVELPILLKYRIGKRWSIYGGPQVNYIYSGREDPAFRRDISKPLTIGFVVGVEYDITRNLSAYVRYTHRFTSRIHPDIGNINGFRLGLAYRF